MKGSATLRSNYRRTHRAGRALETKVPGSPFFVPELLHASRVEKAHFLYQDDHMLLLTGPHGRTARPQHPARPEAMLVPTPLILRLAAMPVPAPHCRLRCNLYARLAPRIAFPKKSNRSSILQKRSHKQNPPVGRPVSFLVREALQTCTSYADAVGVLRASDLMARPALFAPSSVPSFTHNATGHSRVTIAQRGKSN